VFAGEGDYIKRSFLGFCCLDFSKLSSTQRSCSVGLPEVGISENCYGKDKSSDEEAFATIKRGRIVSKHYGFSKQKWKYFLAFISLQAESAGDA
jgi:hypothetical protein